MRGILENENNKIRVGGGIDQVERTEKEEAVGRKWLDAFPTREEGRHAPNQQKHEVHLLVGGEFYEAFSPWVKARTTKKTVEVLQELHKDATLTFDTKVTPELLERLGEEAAEKVLRGRKSGKQVLGYAAEGTGATALA